MSPVVPRVQDPSGGVRPGGRSTRRILPLPGGDTYRLVALVVSAVGVTVLRRYGDVFSASPWAEDFAVFFVQQAEHGYRPFAEYNGLMYVPQRTFAAVWSGLSTESVPLLYNLTAIVVGVLSVAVVLGRRFASLVEPYSYRVLLFALLVLTPAASEINGILTNIHWWFGVSLCLIALLEPPRTTGGKVFELLAVLVMSLAGLSAVIAMPCVVAGAMLHISRYVLLRGATIAAGGAAQLVALTSSGREHDSPLGLLDHLSTVGEIVTVKWGAARLMGEIPRGTDYMDRQEIRAITVVLGGSVLFLVGGCLLRRNQHLAVIGLTASALLALTLGLLVVPGYLLTVLTSPGGAERYFFIPVALLAVIGVIGASSRPQSPFAVALVLACVVGCLSGFRLVERPARDWTSFAKCLEKRSPGIHECKTVIDPNWLVRVQVSDGDIRDASVVPQ